MKKSEITVTMPISAYEELMGIKTKHENFQNVMIQITSK